LPLRAFRGVGSSIFPIVYLWFLTLVGLTNISCSFFPAYDSKVHLIRTPEDIMQRFLARLGNYPEEADVDEVRLDARCRYLGAFGFIQDRTGIWMLDIGSFE